MKTFLVSVLVCLFVCSGLAQNFGPPENNSSTNQLSVWLDLRWNTNNATFHAPATIDIFAYIELRQTELRAGDVVKVDFFSGMNRIGSGKAIWHDAIRPQAPPGYAIPMHILAAQFYPAECVWKKVPPGTYALTAKATWKNLSATSAPLNATVLSQ